MSRLHRPSHKATFTVVCTVLACLLPAAADAQEYPAKPVRLVVGFPPGGANDTIARRIAPKLGEGIGTQVVVENRPGANAILGTDHVAKSPPDGYTLALAGLTPLVISTFTYAKFPYNTLTDQRTRWASP